MSTWSEKYSTGKLVTVHPNGVITHGTLEPIMTALELGGFEMKDFFLIGFDAAVATVIVETQQRADEVKSALGSAYRTEIKQHMPSTDWFVDCTRQDGCTLVDDTVIMEDGKWIQ